MRANKKPILLFVSIIIFALSIAYCFAQTAKKPSEIPICNRQIFCTIKNGKLIPIDTADNKFMPDSLIYQKLKNGTIDITKIPVIFIKIK